MGEKQHHWGTPGLGSTDLVWEWSWELGNVGIHTVDGSRGAVLYQCSRWQSERRCGEARPGK